MKHIVLITITALSVLFFTSCSDDANDSYFDATLKVDVDKLEYGKEGGSKSFDVTVNERNNFIAQWENSVSWGKLTSDVNSVTVTLDPNDTPNNREVRILVYTQNGDCKHYVTIIQTAVNPIFEGVENRVEFNLIGGVKTLYVSTNIPDWTLEGEAEWLRTIVRPSIGEIILIAEENPADESRGMILTLRAGSNVQQITVSQDGVMAMITPFYHFGAGITETLAFESRRGHRYQKDSETRYTVFTMSRLMPIINYQFFGNNNTYSKAIANHAVDYNSPDYTDYINDYAEYLFSLGFTGEDPMYQMKVPGKDYYVRAHIRAYIYAAVFEQFEYQTKDMPTFDKYPYLVLNWGSNRDEAEAYEATLQGVFDGSISDPAEENGQSTMYYNAKEGDKVFSRRAYYYEKHNYVSLYSTGLRIIDVDKILYVASDGKFNLTREYIALLNSENLIFLGTDGIGIIYGKPTEKDPSRYTIIVHRYNMSANFVELLFWEQQLVGEEVSKFANIYKNGGFGISGQIQGCNDKEMESYDTSNTINRILGIK